MKSSSTRRLAIFVAAIAAALTVTFSALGATRPDDRSGIRGADGGTAHVFSGAVLHQFGVHPRPNDRGGMLGVGL